MKKADLKTDGTVYKAVPSVPISQNYGVSDYNMADVVLLDLNDPEQPGSRWGREERRPIRAKLVKGFGTKKRGEIVHLSARRVLMTGEQYAEKKQADAEMRKRWEREEAERRAINEPLAAELNRLQRALGLTAFHDDPLVIFHVDQYGHLKTSPALISAPVELRETLARLEAAATAMGVIGTTEEA